MSADEAQLAFADSLMLRAGMKICDSHPRAEELADSDTAIRDYAASLLARSRVRFDEDKPGELVQRSYAYGLQSTIGATVGAAVLIGFELGLGTHVVWTSRTACRDFKRTEVAYGATVPDLDQIPHAGGSYAVAELSGASAFGSLETYGKILQIGRAPLLANALDTVLHSARAFGIAASLKEASLAYTALLGITYSAGNLNLASSSAAPGTASLEAALSLLRLQTDESGQYLTLPAGSVLVPPGYEVAALGVVTQVWGTDPSRPVVVADPRLSGAWFLMCSKDSRPAVTILTLRGADQPIVEMGQARGFDGLSAKISHDCAALAVSVSGVVKTTI